VRRSLDVTRSANDNSSSEQNVLVVEYRATTNRMLRVATNSFMESLGLVLEVMEKMDVDVLESQKS
jgi:EKC/KEOPS complex subunit PCC1/LAGE3